MDDGKRHRRQADLVCPVCLGAAVPFLTIAAQALPSVPDLSGAVSGPCAFSLPRLKSARQYLTHENAIDDCGLPGPGGFFLFYRNWPRRYWPVWRPVPMGWIMAAVPAPRWPQCCQRPGMKWRYTIRFSRPIRPPWRRSTILLPAPKWLSISTTPPPNLPGCAAWCAPVVGWQR